MQNVQYTQQCSTRPDRTDVSQPVQTDRTDVSQPVQTDRTDVSQPVQTYRTDVSQPVQTDVPFLARHVAPFLADVSAKVGKILKSKNSKSKIEVYRWNKSIL
jgi:hypothetical protein